MQLITDTYKDLNSQLHASRPDYGTSGRKWAGQILELSISLNSRDILDYGCGKSTLAQNLPFHIQQYDPAVTEYSALPKPADIVVCTDVLEHIEPELLREVLDHLASLVKKVGFFVIACRPAAKTLPDGRNAHLIVEPPTWWLSALWERFDVVNFLNLGGEMLVTVTPKGQPHA